MPEEPCPGRTAPSSPESSPSWVLGPGCSETLRTIASLPPSLLSLTSLPTRCLFQLRAQSPCPDPSSSLQNFLLHFPLPPKTKSPFPLLFPIVIARFSTIPTNPRCGFCRAVSKRAGRHGCSSVGPRLPGVWRGPRGRARLAVGSLAARGRRELGAALGAVHGRSGSPCSPRGGGRALSRF